MKVTRVKFIVDIVFFLIDLGITTLNITYSAARRLRYARTRYDFPFKLRFLRNFRKLSIKNTAKLGNSNFF